MGFETKDLTIIGFVDSTDGIGRHPIELIERFHKRLKINFFSTRTQKSLWKRQPHRALLYSFFPRKDRSKRDLSSHVMRMCRRWDGIQGNRIIYVDCLPNTLHALDEKIAYFHSTSTHKVPRDKQLWLVHATYESSKLPPIYAEAIEKYFDAVMVNDDSIAEVYRASGISKPVFSIPLGINLKQELAVPLKSKAHRPFTFSHFGRIDARKNQVKIVEAFARVFGNKAETRLLINGRGGDTHTTGTKILESIRKHDLKNVVCNLRNPVSRREYEALWDQTDCFVNIAIGEGFSIQPREAMARGIPIIISDAFAQKTIAKSGLCRAIHAEKPVPAFFNPTKEADSGYGYDIEPEDLEKALLDVYTNYDKYLALAPKARQWAKQYDITDPSLDSIYQHFFTPSEIRMGDRDQVTPGGIVTCSRAYFQQVMRWKAATKL